MSLFGMMRVLSLAGTVALLSCSAFAQQARAPERDAQSIDILTRVVQASGGLQALSAIHDITESGEITFYWGEGVKGPVSIRLLGADHFRMEADLPDSKKTWVIRNGIGSTVEGERRVPMTEDGALNLENLTYPLSHVAAALADSATDISFVRIEKREGRSVYRLLVKGKLGLADKTSRGQPVVKDLIVDALTYDIVAVGDRPFPNKADRAQGTASREIEYGDFRVVNGVRLPFSISTKLMGQKTLSIGLNNVAFNKNLSDDDFAKINND